MNKTIFFIVGGGIILLLVILVVFGSGKNSTAPPPAELSFWGVGEDESVWQDAIQKFQAENKGMSVQYRQVSERVYEETLVNALAEGAGPDVFFLKNTWIGKHANKLSPLPQSSFAFSPSNFRASFTDGAAEDLITERGDIIGLPLYTDTPALFYNKDTLNADGVALPPKNWDDLRALAKRLTKVSSAGDIIKSGLALGTFDTTEHAFEIINSMILQSGDSVISRKTNQVAIAQPTTDALTLYTSFANPRNSNFSWSGRLGNSLNAFADGSAALAFGFPKDISRVLAKNPHLDFGVVSFPETERPALFGTYFFPAVSRQSKSPEASWRFVAFLASRDITKAYIEKTGRAPARRDLIAALAPTPELAVFYRQALLAKSWPTADEQAVFRIFRDAVESMVSGSAGAPDAAKRLEEKIRQLVP